MGSAKGNGTVMCKTRITGSSMSFIFAFVCRKTVSVISVA